MVPGGSLNSQDLQNMHSNTLRQIFMRGNTIFTCKQKALKFIYAITE